MSMYVKRKKQKRDSEGYKQHGYHTDSHLNKEQHEKIVTTRERREIQQHRKQNRIPTTPTINKAKKQDHKRTIQETKTQRIAINGKHSQTTEVEVKRPNTETSILYSMKNKKDTHGNGKGHQRKKEA